jgi:DNA-binding response OmpR family regulator
VIEDEPKTERYLWRELNAAGFIADWDGGQDRSNMTLPEIYALIVLDLMLSEINGWSPVWGYVVPASGFPSCS